VRWRSRASIKALRGGENHFAAINSRSDRCDRAGLPARKLLRQTAEPEATIRCH
jgi:hypothetical protein